MKSFVYFGFVIITLFITTTGSAYCQIFWSQMGDDIDGEFDGDYSGTSVSISSDGYTVAIGAPGNDGSATDAGHARVYQFNGSDWIQKGGDINGEAYGDQSGGSVCLSSDGSTIAIGAVNNDGNGISSGHVRVYQFNGSNWIQKGGDINGEAYSDQSGGSICICSDGNTVAIGASYNDGNGNNAGHVRVYEYNGASWIQKGFDINGEASGDYSGSVSLSSDGNTLAIGALENDGNGINSGHVRIFQYNGFVWIQKGGDIDGEAPNDKSGISVCLNTDGNKIAIGAPLNSNSTIGSGHARIYEWNDTIWEQIGLDIDGECEYDQSGYRVGLNSNGSIVAVGAQYNDVSGHVRVFEYNGFNWIQKGEDIDGEDYGDQSGCSLCVNFDGSIVAIGAKHNGVYNPSQGHVRVYRYCGTTSTINLTDCFYNAPDGSIYYNSGVFSETTSNTMGCDSIITINFFSLINDSIIDIIDCSFTSSNGNVYTDSGIYYDTLINIYGCDSLLTINFTSAETFNEIYITDCSYTSPGGITYTLSGTYIDTIPNNFGCDSIITIHLVSNSDTSISVTASYSECFYISPAGNTYFVPGIYIDTIPTALGCDSIITIDLSFTNWEQIGEDIDGEEAGVHSGQTVCLSSDGNTLAIGAPYKFNNDSSMSGQVKIFRNINGIWMQKGNDIVSDSLEYQLGWSISLSDDGNIIVIGSTYVNGNNSGNTKIYSYNGSNWIQIGNTITGSQVGDESGWCVSINSDGNIVAIGAPAYDENGIHSGQTRIYYYSGGVWTQMGGDIYGVSQNDFFGFSLSLNSDGTIVAIGAPKNDGNSSNINDNRGHVRVYKYNGADWVQIGDDINGEGLLDESGASVALNADGDIIAIGAPLNNGIPYDSGHVRIFEFNGSSWVQMGSDIDALLPYHHFGYSVKISNIGNTVVIGTEKIENTVKVFDFVEGNWLQRPEDIVGELCLDLYGLSVDLNADGNIIAVGNKENDGNTGYYGDDRGSVRVYKSIIYGLMNVTSCNEFVSPSGTVYTNSGVYYDTVSVNSCDSILLIDLTVLNNSDTTLIISACDSFPSPSGNNFWNISGTYQDTLANFVGCDSVITVDLSVHYSPNVNLGNDITISDQQTTLISGGNSLPNYLWNTGDTVPLIVISGAYLGLGTYYYWLYSVGNNGCSETDTIVITITGNISVEDYYSENRFLVFPNPTSGKLIIAGENIQTIEVFNDLGARIMKYKDIEDIDLSKLPNGIYFLNIISLDFSNRIKIIKQ